MRGADPTWLTRPPRYNLTVKDLLLSGSGDLVSSPHVPLEHQNWEGTGLIGPQYTHFENWKTVTDRDWYLVPGLLIHSNPEN